ncbi:MAG: methyltransferase [Bdellovibrionales bacterium]|nr:methyltransferase [Bdellovibrionales bacterium]
MESPYQRIDALKWVLEQVDPYHLGAPVVFLGAVPHPILSLFPCEELYCYQTLYTHAEQLESAGYKINVPCEKPVQLVLVAGTKHKDYNDLLLQEALEIANDQSQIYFALEQQLGGAALAKQARKTLQTERVYSKARSKVIQFDHQELFTFISQSTRERAPTITYEDTIFSTHPSLFSYREIDRGSRLLINYLERTPSLLTKGNGADLGCGWGLFGICLLRAHPQIEKVSFIDLERHALNSIEETLARYELTERAALLWTDARKFKAQGRRFDWIVSNLPYHQDGSTAYELQAEIVERLPSLLKPGGEALLLWHHLAPRLADSLWKRFKISEIAEAQPPYYLIRICS